MGDENSLQGQTRAHKHSAVSSDGGFLETTITGVTNLSNGSMVYGDASEQVTELSSGNLNDVLTMGVTTPAWVAPTAASSYYTELANETVSGGAANLTASWVGTYQILQIYVYSDSVGATPSGIRWNGDNATNYNGVLPSGASWTGERSTDYTNSSTIDPVWSSITVYNLASEMKLITVTSTLSSGASGSAPSHFQGWNMWTNAVDSIQNCQLVERNSGNLKTFNNDSHLVVLGAN